MAYQYVTPEGDTNVHVELIENLQSGFSIYMQGPEDRKNTKHHNEKHSHGHDSKHKGHEHEQMLTEITAIRSLLHSRKRQADDSHLSSHERILEDLRDLRQQLELRA